MIPKSRHRLKPQIFGGRGRRSQRSPRSGVRGEVWRVPPPFPEGNSRIHAWIGVVQSVHYPPTMLAVQNAKEKVQKWKGAAKFHAPFEEREGGMEVLRKSWPVPMQDCSSPDSDP